MKRGFVLRLIAVAALAGRVYLHAQTPAPQKIMAADADPCV